MTLDVEMPDGQVVSFPEDFGQEQIQGFIYKNFPDLDPINQGNEFTRGLKRGAIGTASLVSEGVPAVAKGLSNEYLGTDFDPTQNLEAYNYANQKATELYPTSTPSFRDVEGLGGVGDFIASTAGEQVPQLGASILSGGVGGLAAKQGVATLAKRAGKELTEKELNKALNKGLVGGTLTTSLPQNVPESYFNLLQEGADTPTAAVLTGALKSGLDVIPQIGILKRVLGPNASDILGDTLLKRMGTAAVTTGVQEGVTETAQEGLDLIAEKFILDNDLLTQENIDSLINAGLKGAIGGGITAGVTAPLAGVETKPFDPNNISPEQQQQLDTQFAAEEVGPAPKKEQTPNTSSAILSPLYMDESNLAEIASSGVNTQSLTLVSPEDAKSAQEGLNRLNEVDSYTELYNTPLPAPKEPIQTTDTKGTKVELPYFYSKDLPSAVFLSEVKPTPIRDPRSRIEVEDINALQEAKENLSDVSVDSIELPKELKGAKPRYRQSQLDFETDYDKALFIVSGKNKSKHRQKYVNWLQQNTGKDEQALVREGLEVRQQIKDLDQGQEVISINKPAEPRFQQMLLPNHGNIRDDLVVPKMVAKNLSGIEFTPEATAQMQPILGQMQRILKEVGGSKLRLKPFERLTTGKRGLHTDPVAGAQYLNTVALAINSTTASSIDETLYHEAWHYLERSGAFSLEEQAIIDQQTSKLLKYMNEDEFLRGQDFQVFLSTAEGREELRANAFGKWAKERRNNEKSNKNFPRTLSKFFRKALNFIEKLGNSLKGLGFKSMDDVFTSTFEGGKSINDTLDDINFDNKVARLQRIGEGFQEAHNAEREAEDYKDIIQDARYKSDKATRDSGKEIGIYSRFLRSAKDFAHKNPFFAEVYASASRKDIDNQEYLTEFVDVLGDFQMKEKPFRYRMMSFMADLNKNASDIRRGDEGELFYTKEGVVYKVTNPEVIQSYDTLQGAFHKVLDKNTEILSEQYQKSLKNHLQPNATIDDIQYALDYAEQLDIPETKVAELNAYKDLLNSIDTLKATPFVPRMRFGTWGFTVRDKETDEQVAFYTVEKGEFGKLYNKFQLEGTLKELKEKYSDTSKFDIVGGNGKIKSLDSIENLVPFKLTRALEGNQIDSRFLNNELLSSMLSSNDFNEESYKNLKDKLQKDILTKGFKNRFEESNKYDGYSEDWDRVIHSYFSGAAYYLSSLRRTPEQAALRAESLKLEDDKLRKKVTDYMDYLNSPYEDYMKLRSFNFLWTMGANLSTAALQLMTLPTTTLGGMNRFNPNGLSNMTRLGKWFGLSKEFFPSLMKTVQTHNGLMYADFRNASVIKDLIKKGKMSEPQARFLHKMSTQIRGFQTEEYSGFKPFETRSLGGSLKGKLSTAANVLGFPISTMEQMTRFATSMASFDMLNSNPKALARAKKYLENDALFQAERRQFPEYSEAELVAKYITDDAHAVFGKKGRPSIFKGLGGSLFLPFMTYPQQALEFIIRSGGHSPDGLRGSLTTVGALFAFSGLIGLPGAELFKELYEEIEKQITGSEEDLDFFIREKIYDATGDVRFGKFVTHGIGRAYFDLDVSRRIGLPIVGQDLLLNLLGIKGDTKDVLGVSGSFVESIGNAWNEYNNDSGLGSVAAAMLPVAPANVFKASQMGSKGVATSTGTQLLTPEEVEFRTKAARFIGVTTDQIASKREELFARMLSDRKYLTAIERFRTRAKKVSVEIANARLQKDWDLVRSKQKEYKGIMDEFTEYAIMNDIAPDFAAFNTSVVKAARQRLDPTIRPKDARALGRRDFMKTQEAMGY